MGMTMRTSVTTTEVAGRGAFTPELQPVEGSFGLGRPRFPM